MAKSLNALATQIYNQCLADGEPVTEEEALEMARMELNVKTAEIVDAGHEKGKTRKPKTTSFLFLNILYGSSELSYMCRTSQTSTNSGISFNALPYLLIIFSSGTP